MAARRIAVVAELRNRVEKNLSTTLVDTDCVSVCIAAAFPRDRDEILGFLLNSALSKRASNSADALALQEGEWAALFGKGSVLLRESTLLSMTNEPEFKEHAASLSDALRCSLTESVSKAAWQKASCKLSCYVSLYTDSSEEWVSHVIGGLVKADTRRLDDVRCGIEDSETDHMLLSRAVNALASCVA